MRLIKQVAEIDMLQRAIDVTAAGNLAAMRASRNAQNEGEVAAAFQGTVRSLGARFTGYDDCWRRRHSCIAALCRE